MTGRGPAADDVAAVPTVITGARLLDREPLFELVLLYLPFGFAVAASVRRRHAAVLMALACTIVVAGSIEYLQGWIVGRYGDVTDVAVSVLGAAAGVWAGGTGWRQFPAASSNRSRTPSARAITGNSRKEVRNMRTFSLAASTLKVSGWT